MARVALPKPKQITDPAVEGIFAWVTEMEGSVPNHFYVELNFPEFFTAKLGATKVLWDMGELTMEEIQRRHSGIASQWLSLLHRSLLHHSELWSGLCRGLCRQPVAAGSGCR